MLFLAAHLLAYAPPVKVPVNGVSADCSTSHLEVDCQVTGLPVIDNIGFDAGIDTSALEVNVDILYDGKKYSIYHLSAHNPELCIDEIVVAKVCAKVENLEWSGGEVSGTLYVGVGVVIVGTKYFKVTDFDFDFDEKAAPKHSYATSARPRRRDDLLARSERQLRALDLAKYGLTDKPQCPAGATRLRRHLQRRLPGGGCPHSGDGTRTA